MVVVTEVTVAGGEAAGIIVVVGVVTMDMEATVGLFMWKQKDYRIGIHRYTAL